MSEARIGKLLKAMDDPVLEIEGFIDGTEDVHQILRSHKEAKRKKITDTFYMIQKQVNVLFDAILSGWSYDCHERHHAMLRLEDRCQDDPRQAQRIARRIGYSQLWVVFLQTTHGFPGEQLVARIIDCDRRRRQ